MGVEDIEYNRIYLGSILEEAGCEVVLAGDGPEGLERAREGCWDVLLLDWDLPGMTGLEITRQLRGEGFAGVIIGMTAFATEAVRRECMAAGMDAFVTKPLGKEALWEMMAHAWERRGGEGSGGEGSGEEAGSGGGLGFGGGDQPWAGAKLEESMVQGRGMLGEMEGEQGWAGHKARWDELLENLLEEVAGKVERAEDLESIRKAAHRLLGHFRMVECRELPERVQALLEAAHAGDRAAVNIHWEAVCDLVPLFREEWERW